MMAKMSEPFLVTSSEERKVGLSNLTAPITNSPPIRLQLCQRPRRLETTIFVSFVSFSIIWQPLLSDESGALCDFGGHLLRVTFQHSSSLLLSSSRRICKRIFLRELCQACFDSFELLTSTRVHSQTNFRALHLDKAARVYGWPTALQRTHAARCTRQEKDPIGSVHE